MKKSIINFLLAGAGLLSSTSFAMQQAYTIELCSIPLKEINPDNNAPDSFQHVFVRGNNGNSITGLNFEPKDKTQFVFSESMVGTQNYPSATCALLKQFNDLMSFNAEWSKFDVEYQEASKANYSAASHNCQTVTEGILLKFGYTMPQEIAETLKQQSELLNITKNFSPELVQGAQQALNGCKQQ